MNIISKTRPNGWRTMEVYYIDNVNNATDEEMINFCDPNNFGGYVTRYANNKAQVIVNID